MIEARGSKRVLVALGALVGVIAMGCGSTDGQAASADAADAQAPDLRDASSRDGGAPEGGKPPNVQDASIGHDAAGADAAGEGGGVPLRKRGIAYGHSSDADLAALSAGIGWWYNWSPAPEATLTQPHAGVEFVPMIWGGTFDTNALATQIPAGAKFLLTFNEPNFGAQSNLTPEQAAALWPKIEAFASARGMAIVSPALNYCGGSCNVTNPFDWLDRFFAACTGCRVDYIGAHWYACTKAALANYLQQYETKYKKPIWLTEFSCLDDATITEAKEEQYMKDAVALLEADPMVFRYSWFTGRFSQQPAIDTLGATSGTLTPLGQQYVSLPRGP